MTRLGFRVKELIGGLDWWKTDGYKTASVPAGAGTADCGCQ
jgi:rhodanese-related sulfurtransferase